MLKKSLRLIVLALFPMTMTAQNAPQLRADNIDEVLAAMTLEEKAQLLVGGANNFFNDGAVVGGSAETVPGAAGTTAAIPRLGIPETILTDGPAGVRINPTRQGDSRTYYATGFPIGTCLASTWNTDLVRQVGQAIGNETKEYNCDVILGPGMNLHRNPLCGRNFEYYSEDPVVTGKIAAAYINGVQSEGAGVSAKHFAVNSQETARTSVDERLSIRAARELYLKGFEIAVRESNPWTFMAAYNRINGEYAQCYHDLLTKVLRDDWGYKGIVMTDWIGIRGDLPVIDEVKAGDDLLEPGQPKQVEEIVKGVKNGTLDIADVDRNVRRMLEYIVKTPHFKKFRASNQPDLQAHARITRESANEGIVLLKNNGALPWKGEKAVKTVALFGVGSYDFLSGGTGSGCVHTPYVVDLTQGLSNAGIETSKTLTDIYRKYVEYAKVKFQAERHPARWYQMEMFGQQKYPEISISPVCVNNELKGADAAIVTIGRQAGEGVDRDMNTEFNLIEEERQLIYDVCNAFHAEGKPVVVVINSGSVIETASWSGYPDAIVCAWQPGEEGGNSVVDILTGRVNPSGKLTMTWPIAAADHPSTKNYPGNIDFYSYQTMKSGGNPVSGYDYTNHEEDIYVGYRFFDTFGRDVAYPFGYGLSYTTFEYSKPTVSQKGENIEVTVQVKNTGSVAGKEVVQVYVSAPEGSMEKPAKELKAFGKTAELKPGQSETLRMTLQRRDLASFDESQSAWVVDAGNYTFHIGASVADIRQKSSLRVDAMTEKTSQAMAPQQALNLLKRKK